MKRSIWLFIVPAIAAGMTGMGMYALLGAMQLSGYVRNLGYGDDWLMMANPLAALVTLIVGVRLRQHWWLGIIGLILSCAFLWQMRLAYLESSQVQGLGGLGKVFAVWLACATGITFLMSLAVAGTVLGMIEWVRKSPVKVKMEGQL